MLYRQSLQVYSKGIDLSTSLNFCHTQSNPTPSFGTIGAVVDTMQACMVGGIQAAWLAPVSVIETTPLAGPYSSCWDKAIFTWRSSGGLVVKTVIPAPGSIFLPDASTVDLADPAVAAYVAACIAALCDSSGNPLAVVTRATRARYLPGIG